jgi:uncharacterized membrane protein HdeD (DUF308 family)
VTIEPVAEDDRRRERESIWPKLGRAYMSTTAASSSAHEAHTAHIFLTRGIIALVWAAAFMGVATDQRGDVEVGAGILLVLYPLIDVVGNLLDARGQQGSTRQWLLGNAAFSLVAAAALGVAATGQVADVLVVFGVWAAVAGAAQLIVALRRRAVFGNQWPLLLAGSVSVIGGVAFIVAGSVADNPRLDMLAIYAATGGVEFIIQAWLLTRRRHGLATLPAPS